MTHPRGTLLSCRLRGVESSGFEGLSRLFALLEAYFPIIFREDGDGGKPAGEIHFETELCDSRAMDAGPVPQFVVPARFGPESDCGQEVLGVNFADLPEVPPPFRARRLRTAVTGGARLRRLREYERVLACDERGPLWTVAQVGGVKIFRSALALPRIVGGMNFADVFGGERFLELLPLLQFLRELCGDALFLAPPMRAAFIIDDPNLHSPRYGCVDYRELARRAEHENYHVAFATVPLDTWYTSGSAARIFRQNGARLSLLVHGNNHAHQELAQPLSDEARGQLLRQSLSRIRRLERNAGVSVCRLMVPPHGACSSAMLSSLSRNGFEAACISDGSLRASNPDGAWTSSLGFRPASVIGDCSVMPRWGIGGNVENTVLVAAYLGRPMILRAHHRDLREGPEVLDGYARFINGLGKVQWGKLSALSRLSYLWRLEGTTLRVQALARGVTVPVPAAAVRLQIDAWSMDDGGVWSVTGAEGSIHAVEHRRSFDLAGAGPSVSLDRDGPLPMTVGRASPGRTSVRLVCRRLLAEARDRLWRY